MTRKEERIFVKLAGKRGALRAGAATEAIAYAKAKGVSLVKALIETGGVSLEAANAIQEAMVELAFECPKCKGADIYDPDEPRNPAKLCDACSPPAPPPSTRALSRAVLEAATPEAKAPTAPPTAAPPAPGKKTAAGLLAALITKHYGPATGQPPAPAAAPVAAAPPPAPVPVPAPPPPPREVAWAPVAPPPPRPAAPAPAPAHALSPSPGLEALVAPAGYRSTARFFTVEAPPEDDAKPGVNIYAIATRVETFAHRLFATGPWTTRWQPILFDPWDRGASLVSDNELDVSQMMKIAATVAGATFKKILHSGNESVLQLALNNPNLKPEDVRGLATHPKTPPNILAAISRRREWSGDPQMARELCLNPKTPYFASRSLVGVLQGADLRELSKNTLIPPTLAKDALQMLDKKRTRRQQR